MNLNLTMIIIIILSGFTAAFIDSVVGGGGLVSASILLTIGLLPSVALGTNKLASSPGSLTSTIKLTRSGEVDLYVVAKLFGFIFLVSACDTYIVTVVLSQISESLTIIILSSVLMFILLKKGWGNTHASIRFTFRKAILFAVPFILIGFYDGFTSEGIGPSILFALLIFDFDSLSAVGNAKVSNSASNIGALVLSTVLGQVDYIIGLVMVVSMIVGSCTGAHFATKQGTDYVKVLFIIITAILILKNAPGYIQQFVQD